MAEHVINLDGSGYFSKGTCTGCDWVGKGHADDLAREHAKIHQDAPVKQEPPVNMSGRIDLPPIAVDPVVADLELRAIRRVSEYIEFKRQAPLQLAVGLAEARGVLMGKEDPYRDALVYTGNLAARIAQLSPRLREKLRHPARDRAEMQTLLETT